MAFVNPFRFSTKYCDDETGHYYYGYRYYLYLNFRLFLSSHEDLGRWDCPAARGRQGSGANEAFTRCERARPVSDRAGAVCQRVRNSNR